MDAQDRRWALGLALAIGLFWLVRCYLWRGPLGPYVGDFVNFFVPLYESAFGYMASGRLPLWNPYNLCGIPWLAAPQVAAFYPGHWLYMVMPSQIGIAISHVGHLLLIGLTTAWFARRLGLSTVAAALAGLLFAVQGVNQFWMLWPSLLETGVQEVTMPSRTASRIPVLISGEKPKSSELMQIFTNRLRRPAREVRWHAADSSRSGLFLVRSRSRWERCYVYDPLGKGNLDVGPA